VSRDGSFQRPRERDQDQSPPHILAWAVKTSEASTAGRTFWRASDMMRVRLDVSPFWDGYERDVDAYLKLLGRTVEDDEEGA
jgi:hypothetical protein